MSGIPKTCKQDSIAARAVLGRAIKSRMRGNGIPAPFCVRCLKWAFANVY